MPTNSEQTGHRKRLREKFVKSGLTGFHDYEIVELLLSLGTPRKDCKQQAKEAIRKFENLRGVLEASPEELQKIDVRLCEIRKLSWYERNSAIIIMQKN